MVFNLGVWSHDDIFGEGGSADDLRMVEKKGGGGVDLVYETRSLFFLSVGDKL